MTSSSPRNPAPGDPVDDPHDDAKEAPAKTRLSLTQVVASALAAVSATVLMSFFGVAGTIIGAGLASVVTVIGNFLYTRSIEKTHEQLKPVVTKVVARTGPAAPRSRTAAMRVTGTATTARGTVVSTSDAADARAEGTPGDAPTVERRSVTETLADGTVPGTQPLDATAPLGETRPLGPVGAVDAGLASADGESSDDEGPDGDLPEGEEPEPRNAWLRFVEKHGTGKVLAMSAAALFVVVMGVVLVVELVIGKPLSDAVRGQEGSGTSISRTSNDSDDSTTVPTPTSPAEDPANVPGDDSGTDRDPDESTTGTTDGSTDQPTDGSTPDGTTGTDPGTDSGTDTPTDGSTGGTTGGGTDDGTGTGTDGSDGGTGDGADGSDDTGGGTDTGSDTGAGTGTGGTAPDAEQGSGSSSGSAQDGAATPTPTPAS
ncbi:hypothetical protein [Isoptericola sp. NPDC056605]|uniref:hypothetical protein n=1 Tax=Isoptericola sp. NPDC056605 TaxID=3345876 RepID=UPI00367BBAC5